MGFQKNVLVVALVILVIAIVFMAAIIQASEEKKKWPPEISTCPPYYKLVHEGDERIPHCQFIDSNRVIGDPDGGGNECRKFSLMEGNRRRDNNWKKTWAQRCKVHWDGISS